MATLVELIRQRRRLGVTVPRRPPQPTRVPQPDHVRREYQRRLVAITRALTSRVQGRVLDRALMLARTRRDDERDEIRAAIEAALALWTSRYTERDLVGISFDVAELTREFNRRAVARSIESAINIDVLSDLSADRRLIQRFIRENTRLIKSVERQYIGQVREAIFESFEEGSDPEVLVRRVLERGCVAESRARLIARDQVGKLNGDLTRAHQKSVGVDRYIWRTERDGRVRPAHRAREGRIIAWDEPPYDGHPGHAINCRCEAQPYLDDVLERVGEAPMPVMARPRRASDRV